MIEIYKNVGETPLQALSRLRMEKPELENETLSYAGRLDPMAEGVMLVLVGKKENKEREKYLNLDKEYEVEILFGFETDTHDILGLVTQTTSLGSKASKLDKLGDSEIKTILKKFTGTFTQSAPEYSSKNIAYKRKNKDLEEQIKEVTIYSAKLLSISKNSSSELLKNIISRINLVTGDFRQEKIIESWKKELEKLEKREGNKKDEIEFTLAKVSISCSSGTYMRSLAHRIGQETGSGAIAYSIKRTKVIHLQLATDAL